MSTIKEEVDIIAFKIGKQDDEPTKRMIFDLIQDTRVELIRRFVDKYQINPPNVVKELKWIPIEKIKGLEDTKANKFFKNKYEVYRSTQKLPRTIHLKTPYPYIFVGEPTRSDSLDYIMPEDIEFVMSRDFHVSGYYTVIEEYLYVFNYTKKAVNVRLIPSDLKRFLEIVDINNEYCFEDFPLEEDFSRTIRQMVMEELASSVNQETEVKINEDE